MLEEVAREVEDDVAVEVDGWSPPVEEDATDVVLTVCVEDEGAGPEVTLVVGGVDDA